jgi:NAD(P)-dependent dehydrogenase (short-subunit alcohol dehydrogenase family)
MNLVVTGSSSGIGRALVERLVARGHRVWGIARSPQAPVPGGPGSLHPLACDVSDWDAVAAAAAAIAATTGHMDGLVTCAGVQGELGPALTADPRQWSATVRANLDGTYFAIRGFADLLARGRRAKVVCLSGGGATKARANFSAYGAAKTAVVRLVENIAEETRGRPFDINAIAPGAINTRLTDEVIRLGPAVVGQTEYDTAVKQKASGGGSLEKALGLIEYLLSEKSDGITGRLLAAPWDPWATLGTHAAALAGSDIYTLRRILPEERGQKFE